MKTMQKSNKRIELALRALENRRQEKEREKEAKLARQQEEAKQREWLRKQRTRPRIELPSTYAGESIFVHKKIYEGFMKNRRIDITSCQVIGGIGGKLILEYTTKTGGLGKLELQDLGPMPL